MLGILGLIFPATCPGAHTGTGIHALTTKLSALLKKTSKLKCLYHLSPAAAGICYSHLDPHHKDKTSQIEKAE